MVFVSLDSIFCSFGETTKVDLESELFEDRFDPYAYNVFMLQSRWILYLFSCVFGENTVISIAIV